MGCVYSVIIGAHRVLRSVSVGVYMALRFEDHGRAYSISVTVGIPMAPFVQP